MTTLPPSFATATGTGSGRLVLCDPEDKPFSGLRRSHRIIERVSGFAEPADTAAPSDGRVITDRLTGRSTGAAVDAQPALAAVVSSFQAW